MTSPASAFVGHAKDCGYQYDQNPADCTCGVVKIVTDQLTDYQRYIFWREFHKAEP